MVSLVEFISVNMVCWFWNRCVILLFFLLSNTAGQRHTLDSKTDSLMRRWKGNVAPPLRSSLLINASSTPNRQHTWIRNRLLSQTSRMDVAQQMESCPEPKKQIAKLTALICTLISCSNYVVTKRFQKTVCGELFYFLKLALASLVFVKDVLTFRGDCDTITAGFELGLWYAIGVISQMNVLKTSSVGRIALYTSLGSVLPPLFDLLFERKISGSTKKSAKKTNSVVSAFVSPMLAIIGIVVVELSDLKMPFLPDFLLLVPPFAVAMYRWRAQTIIHTFPQNEKVISGLCLLVSAIVCCFWAIWQSKLPLQRSEWLELVSKCRENYSHIALLFYSAIACSALTTFCNLKLFRVFSVVDTRLMHALEPIAATFFAYCLTGEHLTGWGQVMGTGLMVLACFFVED